MDNSGGFGFANDGTFGVFATLPNDQNITGSSKFRHPWAVVFHILFKIGAIFIYLFGSLFVNDFLRIFVILIFLISIDFWVVKNITGRLLVGLRWWNYIDDDGQSHWVFENRSMIKEKSSDQINDVEFILFNNQSHSQSSNVSSGSDSSVFWLGLFIFSIFWFLSLLSAIFSFNIHWVLLVGIALVLNGSNLYGYIRCRFGTSQNNYGSVISSYGPKILFNLMSNSSSSTNNIPRSNN